MLAAVRLLNLISVSETTKSERFSAHRIHLTQLVATAFPRATPFCGKTYNKEILEATALAAKLGMCGTNDQII